MERLFLLLIPAALGLGVFFAGRTKREDKLQPCDDLKDVSCDGRGAEINDNNAAEDEEKTEPMLPAERVRASIRRVKRDMNPVTLSPWTRIVCSCADGQERTMSFDGENGKYLAEGDTGVLEHRAGVFVSFEKDSGEVVAQLYHIPAEEK